MHSSPEPSHHRRDSFSLSRFPNAIDGMKRLEKRASPFEPTLLKWEQQEQTIYAEWLEPPSRSLQRVLGHDSEFNLKRRIYFGQDILDYCLLTGERPSAKMTHQLAVDHNFRLHIPFSRIPELNFSFHDGIDITALRFDWEDPLRIGDAYSSAAVLSTLLRATPMKPESQEHIEMVHKRFEEFRNRKDELAFLPIPELSQDLNQILSSALNPDPATRITRFQELRSLYMDASRSR